MERGPMALFGAIIAVGLGPAMWLGAQFGEVTLTPERPPAVTSVRNDVEVPRGGSGAGDAPTEAEAIRTEPKADTEPLSRTRNVRPATTKSPTPSPSPSDEPSTPPVSPSSPTPPDSGGEESDPPTESSSPPQDPPGDEDPEVPSKPPTDPRIPPEPDPVTVQISQV